MGSKAQHGRPGRGDGDGKGDLGWWCSDRPSEGSGLSRAEGAGRMSQEESTPQNPRCADHVGTWFSFQCSNECAAGTEQT